MTERDVPTAGTGDQPAGGSAQVDVVAARAGVERSLRGVFAAILVLEAFTLLLVPRTIAGSGELSAGTLTVTLGLAAALVVLSGMQRRSWGFPAGCVAQVAFLAIGFLTTAMFALGVVFGAIWLAAIRLRRQLLERVAAAGSPPG